MEWLERLREWWNGRRRESDGAAWASDPETAPGAGSEPTHDGGASFGGDGGGGK